MTQSNNTEDLARRIRVNAVNMVDIQGFGYLGQALGTAEIMAVIFGENYWRQGVDRFVLSPGHYAITFYAVAAEIGLLAYERRDRDAPRDELSREVRSDVTVRTRDQRCLHERRESEPRATRERWSFPHRRRPLLPARQRGDSVPLPARQQGDER